MQPMQPNIVPMHIPLREEAQETAAIMPLRFWTTYENVNVAKPGEVAKFETKSHEWVSWAKKGVSIPFTHDDKVARARKDPTVWRALAPFYDNWKSGGATSLMNPDHTPLEAWGGITRDEIEALKPYRIYSVEDFAEMNDQVMGKIPMRDIAARRDRAKKFLATQHTADEVKAVLGDEIAKLQAQLAEMRAQMGMPAADPLAKPAAKGKKVAAA